MGKHPPAYLTDGTYTFTFSTHAFAGIGTQLPVFAVGALAAIHSVVAADTLTARDPLRGRREEVNGIVDNHNSHPVSKTQHPLSRFDLEPSTLIWTAVLPGV